MTSSEARVRELLSEWMGRFVLPPLQDERRKIEELSCEMVQNFFILLLAACEEPWPDTPWLVLEKLAPDLATPLPEPEGSPFTLSQALGIGKPNSEIFQLQQHLLDQVSTERRAWLWKYGYM